MNERGEPGHDAWAALRIPDFRLLVTADFLSSLAQAVLSVLIGWELYLRTGSALALGLVGLVQIIPNVVLALPIGHFADRHDQKWIATLAVALNAVAALALTVLSATTGPLVLIYASLALIGVGRTFHSATEGALMAATAPVHRFGNAAAWSSSAGQTAAVLGPALGGFAIAVLGQTTAVFAFATALLALASLTLSRMHPRQIARMSEPLSVDSLFAGVRFIRRTPVLLAAITLDMVAVLLGGATALLPIFADEVLHVGASGLGLLRAAPAVGAVLMSLAVVHHGAFKRAGPTLLLVVAGFGLATLLFGASRSLLLSLAALALAGAFDAVSRVIRHTLELTYTPDVMRGRVSAIHNVFIGLSNEFGEFESGVMAALFGATTAVLLGGVGTLLVVGVIAAVWPQVRHLGRIEPLGEVDVLAPDPLTGPVNAAPPGAR